MNHQDDQPLPRPSLETLRERVRLQGERVRDLRRAADSMQQLQPARAGRHGQAVLAPPADPAASPSTPASPK